MKLILMSIVSLLLVIAGAICVAVGPAVIGFMLYSGGLIIGLEVGERLRKARKSYGPTND